MNKKDGDNSTFHKRKTRLLRGKTKQILILIPAVLLITCILAISMASSQIQANELSMQANSISAKNGGMSLIGNLTTVGNTALNGNLTLTGAEQVILDSPLVTSGEMNMTADSIEIGKPTNENGTITLTGNASFPSTLDLYGNILIGDPTTANGMLMNVTDYYQLIESQGTGYIGSIGSNISLPVNSNTAMRVLQGTLYLNQDLETIMLAINSTHCVTLDLTIDLSIYDGVANTSQILIDLGLPVPPGGIILAMHSLWWNQSVTFEAWGDPGGWFGIESGVINVTDTHLHIESNGSIYHKFLSDSSEASFRITPGAQNFTKAEMNLVTQEQNVTGLGSTYITNGSLSSKGTITLPLQQIINGVIDFEGEMLLDEGDLIIQGTFETGGESFIEGPVSISGSLNINGGTMSGTGTIMVSDGYMKTVGGLKISNGGIEVLNGKVTMNSSGTYIGSETSITGDLTIEGTVKNSGLLSMSGTFQIFTPLSITGSMVTIGVTSMGSLGAINGILSIMGNVIMSGMTVISGDNNVIGSMTVTPVGVMINGLVGLTGVVHTTGGLPAMSSSTILEVSSGSMMGVPIPHVSLMANPLALLALGILGIGTVWVAIRGVYIGIKERRTLAPRIRRTGERLENIINKADKLLKRLSEAVNKLPKRLRRG